MTPSERLEKIADIEAQVAAKRRQEEIPPLHVVVKFGSEIPSGIQGVALLEFERILRKLQPGKWIEAFKEAKGDDSKLRAQMTVEQRAKL